MDIAARLTRVTTHNASRRTVLASASVTPVDLWAR